MGYFFINLLSVSAWLSSGRPVGQRDGSVLRQHADPEAFGIVGWKTSEHHGSGVRAPPLISTCSTHSWTDRAAHAWITSLLCQNVDSVAVTLSHASFFPQLLVFPFCPEKPQVLGEADTGGGKNLEGDRVKNWVCVCVTGLAKMCY